MVAGNIHIEQTVPMAVLQLANLLSQRHDFHCTEIHLSIYFQIFVNVVKYKLDHMRRKMETEERNATSRSSFRCPSCEKTYTDLQVSSGPVYLPKFFDDFVRSEIRSETLKIRDAAFLTGNICIIIVFRSGVSWIFHTFIRQDHRLIDFKATNPIFM